MSYPDEESGGKYVLNGQKLTRESLKQQAITLIRLLIKFSGTLEHLPGDRFLTMKNQYYESTPQDYEPTFFKPSDSDVLKFEESQNSRVMRVKIGINTD
jgi:hypothetical protein